MFTLCNVRSGSCPGSRTLAAIARVVKHIRARVVRAFVLYLAKPGNAIATLTSSDLQAMAAVLDPGDVLLSAGNTRCAALVKRVTRSTWSHVSMYVGPLDDASDPLCIVEADVARGVRPIRLSQLDAHRVRVLRPIKLDDTERRRLAESVVSRIGSEYDLRHAWTLARTAMMRRRLARIGSVPINMEKDATRFICSSLIAQAFVLLGHSILPLDTPGGRADALLLGHLTPADFAHAPAFETVWSVNRSRESG